jgi:O-antigen ligase
MMPEAPLQSARTFFPASAAPALALVVLGALVGLTAFLVGIADIRWLVALASGIVAIAVVAILPNRRHLLWLAFVFSFQFTDPNLRLLYGHAGSDGLVFTMPFLLGVCVIAGALATGAFRNRPIRWCGPFGLPIALLFGVLILASVASSEHFTNFTQIVMQLEFYVLYLVGLNLVINEEGLRTALKVLFVVLTIQCLVYYAETALNIAYVSLIEVRIRDDGMTRPGGTIGPNPFAFDDFILPILLILVADFMCRKGEGALEGLPRGILIAMSALALALSLTRSAWGSFAIGCAYLGIVEARRKILSGRKVALLSACAVLAALAVAPLIVQRLEREGFDRSYDERLALMKMAVNVVEANPLLGVGPGAYSSSFKQYLTPDLADKWLYVVHNHYLLRAAETGIPGALVFVFLLATAVRLALSMSRSRVPIVRTLALGVGASVVATMHQMYWDTGLSIGPWQLFWFLLGLLGAAQAQDADRARGIRGSGLQL